MSASSFGKGRIGGGQLSFGSLPIVSTTFSKRRSSTGIITRKFFPIAASLVVKVEKSIDEDHIPFVGRKGKKL